MDTLENLKNQWWELLKPFAVAQTPAETAFKAIVASYSEPGRYYHSLSHIEQVLATVKALEASAHNRAAIYFAAWFHDVIYDSRAKDNEEKSAEYAANLMQAMALPPALIAETARLILCTKAHQAGGDDLAAHILLDADLAILAVDPARYQDYSRAIRQEYAWVSEPDYRAGRKAVLEKFLQRERLYFTAAMFETDEAIARHNLQNEIAELNNGKVAR